MSMTTKKKPAAKKPAARKQRDRKTANKMVYFGCKAGTFVIQSKDFETVTAGGKTMRQEIPEIKLVFGDRGVSRPLHPQHDAELIEEFREYIRKAEEENYWGDYARVRTNNLREVHPDSPARPAPNWETVAPDKIRGIVEALELDIDKCIMYEEYNGNRSEVLDVLDLMAAERDGDPVERKSTNKPSL